MSGRILLLSMTLTLTACAATDFWSLTLVLPLLLSACGQGGRQERCCVSNPNGGRLGIISTCYCPASLACNYGQFTSCGGDTCDVRFIAPPDGGLCQP